MLVLTDMYESAHGLIPSVSMVRQSMTMIIWKLWIFKWNYKVTHMKCKSILYIVLARKEAYYRSKWEFICTRGYLIGNQMTSITKLSIWSKAIKWNELMCFRTHYVIKILQYWIWSSTNGSILPMHYCPHRCSTTIINATLLWRFSGKELRKKKEKKENKYPVSAQYLKPR